MSRIAGLRKEKKNARERPSDRAEKKKKKKEKNRHLELGTHS